MSGSRDLPVKILIHSLIEAARCSGIAQQSQNEPARLYWNGEIEKYRALLAKAAA